MQKYVLVGHFAGKTVALGGHQFVEGVFEFGASPEGVMPSDQEKQRKANLLAKMYQAYPEGSAELEAAQKRLAGNQTPPGELDVGKREDEEQATRQPAGGGGSERQRFGAIRTALTKLDPKEDTHWTDGGLPAVAAVRQLSGDVEVSRQDITALAPKLTREEALKIADEKDPLD